MNGIIFNHQSEVDVQKNTPQQAQNAGLRTTHQSNSFLSSITDEKLFQLCQQYGEQARAWRQKFAGLLPEVNKRQLYVKKGFHSIFEFAAKLAGMSEEQVRLVLNLERKFEDKPMLQSLLVSGEVSANKLVRVASIATVENQETLAEQVRVLPKSALETLVRDEKMTTNFEHADDGQLTWQTKIDAPAKSLHGSLPGQRKTSQLFDDVKLLQKFSEDLKEKLQELDQKGIDINKLLLELLKKREEEIDAQKQEIAKTLPSATSRSIPACVKKILREEFGEKCAVKNCKKLSEQTHHAKRFALSQDHDPRFMARLCRDHHILAHSVDIKFHRTRELALVGV